MAKQNNINNNNNNFFNRRGTRAPCCCGSPDNLKAARVKMQPPEQPFWVSRTLFFQSMCHRVPMTKYHLTERTTLFSFHSFSMAILITFLAETSSLASFHQFLLSLSRHSGVLPAKSQDKNGISLLKTYNSLFCCFLGSLLTLQPARQKNLVAHLTLNFKDFKSLLQALKYLLIFDKQMYYLHFVMHNSTENSDQKLKTSVSLVVIIAGVQNNSEVNLYQFQISCSPSFSSPIMKTNKLQG